MSVDETWVVDLLRMLALQGNRDSDTERLLFRIDRGGALHVAMDCSDIFAWGGADAEPILAEDLDSIRATRAEVYAITDAFPAGDHGDQRWLDHLHWPELWVARKREMRPQGAFLQRYVHSDELRQLFADAGPQRQGGVLGDPVHVEIASSSPDDCALDAADDQQ